MDDRSSSKSGYRLGFVMLKDPALRRTLRCTDPWLLFSTWGCALTCPRSSWPQGATSATVTRVGRGFGLASNGDHAFCSHDNAPEKCKATPLQSGPSPTR
eukprot:6772729-Pyramimonas_sp.AAC.1